MDCPHLNISAKITSIDVKCETYPIQWTCCACQTSKSPWICLACGVVNCGRYVNGHANEHHLGQDKHTVCMDCHSYAAYCYICDDFVINDTKSKHLAQLRRQLQLLNDPETPSEEVTKRRNSCLGGSSQELRKKRTKQTANTKLYCKVKISGLRNLGNTCFMNAVLQSLSNIQQFSCYFKQLPSLEHKTFKNGRKNHTAVRKINGLDDVLLTEELRKTLISLWQGSKAAISPESLFAVIWKVVPRFRGYQQQDAHEFLRYILDRLHMELLNILPSDGTAALLKADSKSTIVTSIFGGVLQNEVTCLRCGTDSKKHDPFLDLSLDIPSCGGGGKSSEKGEGDASSEPPTASCHLLDCLDSFTELEELTETELYHCHSCKRKQRSTKQFWIRRLPNVLCLHLKRFRWNNYFRLKVDSYVEFPLQGLDMTKFLLENMHETRRSSCGSTLYDLAAVIVHHGSGAGSGHYTAYATHEGCWHHFNDSTVTPSDEETVAKSKAYILFYIRRQLNLSSFAL